MADTPDDPTTIPPSAEVASQGVIDLAVATANAIVAFRGLLVAGGFHPREIDTMAVAYLQFQLTMYMRPGS